MRACPSSLQRILPPEAQLSHAAEGSRRLRNEGRFHIASSASTSRPDIASIKLVRRLPAGPLPVRGPTQGRPRRARSPRRAAGRGLRRAPRCWSATPPTTLRGRIAHSARGAAQCAEGLETGHLRGRARPRRWVRVGSWLRIRASRLPARGSAPASPRSRRRWNRPSLPFRSCPSGRPERPVSATSTAPAMKSPPQRSTGTPPPGDQDAGLSRRRGSPRRCRAPARAVHCQGRVHLAPGTSSPHGGGIASRRVGTAAGDRIALGRKAHVVPGRGRGAGGQPRGRLRRAAVRAAPKRES